MVFYLPQEVCHVWVQIESTIFCIWTLRGNCIPNQILACFVLYLKIINIKKTKQKTKTKTKQKIKQKQKQKTKQTKNKNKNKTKSI